MGSPSNGRRELLLGLLAGLAVSDAAMAQAAMLDADLGAAIRDLTLEVVLGQIRANDGHVLTAHVAVPVRHRIAAGSLVRIPFLRESNPVLAGRQGFNNWNNLVLSAGAWLALAGRPGGGGIFLPVAGEQAGPPAQSEARLRRAVGYADDPLASPFAAALSRAMAEADGLSASVLLGMALADARLPRRVAVEGLTQVFGGLKPGDPMAPTLAGIMLGVRLFDTERGADALNLRILVALAARVLNGEMAEAADLVPYLRSALLREMSDDAVRDAAIRLALIAGLADRARLATRLEAVGAAAPAQRAGLAPVITLLRAP